VLSARGVSTKEHSTLSLLVWTRLREKFSIFGHARGGHPEITQENGHVGISGNIKTIGQRGNK